MCAILSFQQGYGLCAAQLQVMLDNRVRLGTFSLEVADIVGLGKQKVPGPPDAPFASDPGCLRCFPDCRMEPVHSPQSDIQKTPGTIASYKPLFLQMPLSWALEAEYRILVFMWPLAPYIRCFSRCEVRRSQHFRSSAAGWASGRSHRRGPCLGQPPEPRADTARHDRYVM